MTPFRHILFPIDFSPACQDMACQVRAIAQRCGAKVTLMAVYEPAWQPISAVGLAEATPILPPIVELETLFRDQLERFAADRWGDIQVNRVFEVGKPAEAITHFAETNQVDLIMMPTHGLGRFRRLLLGSVTSKVLHDAPCPVWTGTHLENAKARPIGDSLLCALDLTEEGVSLLRNASDLAEFLGLNVEIAHVVPVSQGWPDRYCDAELNQYLQETSRHEIERLQEAAGTDYPLHLVTSSSVGRGMCVVAKERQPALIVIGQGRMSQPLGGVRTHTYSIIREAPCSVLRI